MHALIDRTIESVQKISGEIRLGQLDRLGLAAAIEVELAEFQTRTRLGCDSSGVTEVVTIARETATGLFRIFQEALTNIARHARARRVEACLRREGSHLVLIVRDDGRGITPAESANSGSLGLLGMRERAQALGGEFEITAPATGGTTVCVRVPDKPSLHR
jgi:signal transduction histidine kinase